MTYLTITIDVEPDCSPTWQYSNPLSFDGVKIGIKERLQPLFNKHEIIPTYLINNVVLESQESVNIFKNLGGKFELGAHLHPEFIEPLKLIKNYAGAKGEANCCSYDEDVEFGKIKSITDLFEEQFGYKPLSFRAGRFSAGRNTIKSLSKLGYKIDTSVTPNLCWSDNTREKPVDFRMCSEQPYWTDYINFPNSSLQKEILEVPVSIIENSSISFLEIFKSGLGLRRKPNFSRPFWLRPYKNDIEGFKIIINYLKKKYYKEEFVVLNMMFHNVEVIPGSNPYTQTVSDVNQYTKSLELFFDFCCETGIKSTSLSSLHEYYQQFQNY